MYRVSIFTFTLCCWVGDPADFYLHLFQLQHLSHSQLSLPEILLKLPLGTMEISDSLSKGPAAPARPLSRKQQLRNFPVTHRGNSFPACNLITILSRGTVNWFYNTVLVGKRGEGWWRGERELIFNCFNMHRVHSQNKTRQPVSFRNTNNI